MSPRARLLAFARGPWPSLLLISLIGWALLPGGGHAMMTAGSCGSTPGAWLDAVWARAALSLSLSSPSILALHWLLMVLAMMTPLIAEPLANLRASVALRHRRAAIALFVVGYDGAWLVAGFLVVPAAFLIGSAAETSRLPPLMLGLLIAALWQVTPMKRAALALCHRKPATAEGNGLRYGLTTALGCFGACWALMLAPFAVHGDDRPLMALVAIALLIERQLPGRAWIQRARRRPPRLSMFTPSAGRIQGPALPTLARIDPS